MPARDLLMLGMTRVGLQAKLLEHNVRFGDPECQCLMMRLQSDLLGTLLDASSGCLAGTQLQWSDQPALTVVLATRGYPGAYVKGTRIGNLDAVKTAKARRCLTPGLHVLQFICYVPQHVLSSDTYAGPQVFHAGTSSGPDGSLVASGGRVLGVAAVGSSVRDAQARAYQARLQYPFGRLCTYLYTAYQLMR